MPRDYDAIALDLDGTLLTSHDGIHPRVRGALDAARADGVEVMLVTGRSKLATLPILDDLGLDSLTVLFNGSAVYCPKDDRMLEERTLSNRALDKILQYGRDSGDMTIVMTADQKLALEPRDEVERRSLLGLTGLEFATHETLRQEYTLRVSFLTTRHEDSAAFALEVERALGLPLYVTHFPLSMLPMHRASDRVAVDVHAPCRGKAEALRVLEETCGIPAARVVAVGDASNDVPLLEGAGLGVAMENSMPEALAAAERAIGHHDSDSIADLIEELFL